MRWWLVVGMLVACGGGDDEGLYAACEVADDCAADVPDGEEAACLDKGDEGFCTWRCDADEVCSDADEAFVCASFESEADRYCFPSCEEGDDACPPGFGCRSTGGGADNRKVCFPEEAG
jgi:hypothetical protein